VLVEPALSGVEGVSRRNELFFSSDIKTVSVIEGKFAMAGHHRQHARRVRYPEKSARNR
jgi:hypothetical protein